jgi:hypothetical protein
MATGLPALFGREQSLAVGARVPWESYVPASLSQADVHAIRALSAAAPARVAELLAARDAEALLYPQALLKVRGAPARPIPRPHGRTAHARACAPHCARTARQGRALTAAPPRRSRLPPPVPLSSHICLRRR